ERDASGDPSRRRRRVGNDRAHPARLRGDHRVTGATVKAADGRWVRYARAPLALRAGVALVVTLAFLGIPALADQWVYAHWSVPHVYDRDWAMALRATGTLYVWIPVALIVWLVQRERDANGAKRRALLIVGSPAVAGLLCEIMKLLIRRERPDVGAGEWV